MAPTKGWVRLRLPAALLALGMVVAACGDDDEDAGGSASTTEEASASGTEETTTTAGGGGDGGDNAELCALAEELFNQDDFPSAEQLQRYQELAPEEIADAVDTAAPPLIAAAGDPVQQFIAFAQDDVEGAVLEIDAFESEECGIDHESTPVLQEPEEGSAVVDVTAVDYDFQLPETIAAGRTSFALTNDGQEAHFLVLTRIAEGHTLEEALAFEGDPEEAGLVEDVEGGESGIAAPGDEEFAVVDLEPGDYAALCFVPGPDGTPHAFMGMAVPFSVS